MTICLNLFLVSFFLLLTKNSFPCGSNLILLMIALWFGWTICQLNQINDSWACYKKPPLLHFSPVWYNPFGFSLCVSPKKGEMFLLLGLGPPCKHTFFQGTVSSGKNVIQNQNLREDGKQARDQIPKQHKCQPSSLFKEEAGHVWYWLW